MRSTYLRIRQVSDPDVTDSPPRSPTLGPDRSSSDQKASVDPVELGAELDPDLAHICTQPTTLKKRIRR